MSIFRDMRLGIMGTYGALLRLIIINCVVFLFANILVGLLEIGGTPFAYSAVSNWIDLPAYLPRLLVRFWTPFTYMFVHFGLLHLIANMLWLYFLGRVFSQLLGGARLTGVYLLGGLAGGILFIAISNLIPNGVNSQLEGASAGVMAVVVAVAAYSPDFMVFPFGLAMRLKWIALIAFVLTTLLDLSQNTGGKAAHIGGAIFGFIYGAQTRLGKHPFEGLMKIFRVKAKKSRLRVEYSMRSIRSNDEAYNSSKTTIRVRVDEILDKISRSGYDSLNPEEKDFLQKNHDKY
ncbi:MAG TPA: rhomboid family intramembrane serine protease [Bacteroidia bacterium]|nr:rhomboid family intramembrane serine protease [Bacteroidia bacterium]